MYRALFTLVFVGVSAIGPGSLTAVAAPAPFCQPGQTPALTDGFAVLAGLIGERMGQPTECAHPDTNGVSQRTTLGLANYIADQNLPVFATDWVSDRAQYWALFSDGLQYVSEDRGSGTTVRLLAFADADCGVLPADASDADALATYCAQVESDTTARSIHIPDRAVPATSATATPPAPTVTPTVSYPTRKGPRTAEQLIGELTRAGYGGPWDVTALLAAYDQATSPTPTPVPTQVPVPTQTAIPARVLDPGLASRCVSFSFALAVSMNQYVTPGSDAAGRAVPGMIAGCQQSALADGVAGEQCYEYALRQAFQINLMTSGGVSLGSIDSIYRGCLGR